MQTEHNNTVSKIGRQKSNIEPAAMKRQTYETDRQTDKQTNI